MRCKSSVVACRNFGSAQVSKQGRGTEGCIAGSTEQATFFRKAHVQLPCDMTRVRPNLGTPNRGRERWMMNE